MTWMEGKILPLRGGVISMGRCWNRPGVWSTWLPRAGTFGPGLDRWHQGWRREGEKVKNILERNGPSGDSCQIRTWPEPHTLFSSPCFTLQNSEFRACPSSELRQPAISCRDNWLSLLFIEHHEICPLFLCFGFSFNFQKVYFPLSRAEPAFQMC